MVFKKTKEILRLSFSLSKINFKLRNEGSYLGIFWYLLDPLVLFLIILLIRDSFLKKNIIYYPIYLLIGLIMFNFFRVSTVNSTNAISKNGNFIKSMNISRESLVISKHFESVFSHFFEVILLAVFMLIYNISLVNLFLYPLIFVFLFLFSLGIGFILATIGVFANDLNNVWNVITRLIWFCTPIFYIIKKGSKIYYINLFNPMFYFISIARDFILYNKISETWIILMVFIFSVFVFVLGLFIFEKYKNKFAEYV